MRTLTRHGLLGLLLVLLAPPALGQDLLYSSFLGGSNIDQAEAIAFGPDGSVIVTGFTASTDFPLVDPVDSSLAGDEVFVTKFSPDGTEIVFSTYLGGATCICGLGDEGYSVTTDDLGFIYVAGKTEASTTFPVTSGAAFSEGAGGFVVKLTPDGDLVYSTLIPYGWAHALDLGADGSVYIAGAAFSDFEGTPGAFDTSYNGGIGDGYVLKLDPTGSAVEWATFLGGADRESCWGIAVDEAGGRIFVCGHTLSANFPTTPGALATTRAGTQDGFVASLSIDGSTLEACTFLGGSATDAAFDVALQGATPVVSGWTTSPDYPTTPGVLDDLFEGFADGIVTGLNPDLSGLVFSTLIGASGLEIAAELEIDAVGQIYVTGRTDTADFPVTPDAYQSVYAGGGCCGDVFFAKLQSDGSEILSATFLGGSEDDTGEGLALSPDGARVAFAGNSRSVDLPTTPGAYDDEWLSGDSWDALVLMFSNDTVAPRFRRGDTNGDGAFDLGDIVLTLETLFITASASTCPDADDMNDDGAIDVSDAVFGLGYLFASGPPLPTPSSECGTDPTPDALVGCSYAEALCP